jgi:hypothetical protein
MRFAPALVGGKKVRQVVTQPFNFQLSDSVKAALSASFPALREKATKAGFIVVPDRP